MSSLHSALETWTVLANRSVQEGKDRKVEFGHYYCAVCFFYDSCLLGQRQEKRALLFLSSRKTFSQVKT